MEELGQNVLIDVECPKCGTRFKKTTVELKNKPRFSCPGRCGLEIDFSLKLILAMFRRAGIKPN
jgi:transcription elongation factor Elf1